MLGTFQISSSNIKGVRKIRDQLDVLIKRLRNRAVEVSTLTTDKVTINKESDDNSDAVLDVLGNVAIDGNLDVSNIQVLNMMVGNESQLFIDACGNIGIGLNNNESLLGGDIKLDVSGDVNLSGNVTFDSSYGILLPKGDTISGQGVDEGTIRYNTEDNIFEGFSLGNWRGLGGVRSVDGETFVSADNSGVLNFVTKGNSQMFIDACGNVSIEKDVTLNGTILNYSDRNLKENLKVLTNSLDNIDKINGYSYTRNDVTNVHQRHLGVIAQEVEAILPDLVYEHDKSKIKSVNYNGLIAMLIECVKELKLENKELKERVNNTEQLLKSLVEKNN